MINKIILTAVVVALLITSGCSGDINGINKNEALDIEETLNEDVSNKDTSNKDIKTAPNLGGISLGDSPKAVINVLGNNYAESTELDNAGFVGEDMNIWTYESGIVVYFGKMTGKVLRVASTSPDLQTDLGIKVGDDAKTVSETYKPLFEEAVSRHSDEMLEGWYIMDDGVVMIFDFDKSDGALVNSNVMPDSNVEEIILAYWKQFD